MTHEHAGECCSHHHHDTSEHTLHEHRHHAVERIGSLCCKGMCSHPEHSALSQLALHTLLDRLHEETVDDDEEDEDETEQRVPRKWHKQRLVHGH